MRFDLHSCSLAVSQRLLRFSMPLMKACWQLIPLSTKHHIFHLHCSNKYEWQRTINTSCLHWTRKGEKNGALGSSNHFSTQSLPPVKQVMINHFNWMAVPGWPLLIYYYSQEWGVEVTGCFVKINVVKVVFTAATKSVCKDVPAHCVVQVDMNEAISHSNLMSKKYM